MKPYMGKCLKSKFYTDPKMPIFWRQGFFPVAKEIENRLVVGVGLFQGGVRRCVE